LVPTQVNPAPPVIINPTARRQFIDIPWPDLNRIIPTPKKEKIITSVIKPPNGLIPRLEKIRHMEQVGWQRNPENFAEADGNPRGVVAKFPVYLASYANGDWDCNVHLSPGGNIDAGSLPDLIAKVNEWSHEKIKGTVVPTPLDIGSPDLLAKMPPFILFTGHKDFVLTGTEIENLRTYLENGGAIWGDNALPGDGSRFGIAFRREMKRVVPDKDKNFEDLPLTHEIFTKSWFDLTQVPPGMNYYAEPLQHLDIDGKIAIIYTPNDYSDLFFMRILPGDVEEGATESLPNSPLFTNSVFLYNRRIFFRNFQLDSALQAQRLGMNILGFLLVRFDKELLLGPP
jgi:hypothetical protein